MTIPKSIRRHHWVVRRLSPMPQSTRVRPPFQHPTSTVMGCTSLHLRCHPRCHLPCQFPCQLRCHLHCNLRPQLRGSHRSKAMPSSTWDQPKWPRPTLDRSWYLGISTVLILLRPFKLFLINLLSLNPNLNLKPNMRIGLRRACNSVHCSLFTCSSSPSCICLFLSRVFAPCTPVP